MLYSGVGIWAYAAEETGDGAAPFFESLNSVVGVAVNWIQVAQDVAQLIENIVLPSPDPIAMLDGIAQNVNELLQGEAAEAAITKMLHVTDWIQPALDRLNKNLNALKHGQNVQTSDLNDAFNAAQDAAYVFADDSYWLRPYLQSFVFSDFWFPKEGSPPQKPYMGYPFVYDSQLSLPSFALAISIFVSAASWYYSDDLGTAQPYFTDLANILYNHYQKVTQGLQMVPIPTTSDLGAFEPGYWGSPRWGLGFWRGEIGAVDTYSVFSKTPGSLGYALGEQLYPSQGPGTPAVVPTINVGNIIDVYPDLYSLTSLVGAEDIIGEVVSFNITRVIRIRMQIGNWARYKALYLAKGYDRIRSLVQKLIFLSSGQSGTPLYNFPPMAFLPVSDRNSNWFLSDFDVLLSGFVYANYYEALLVAEQMGHQFQPPPVSAEDVISRLQGLVAYATAQRFSENPQVPVVTPNRPMSLRSAIAVAAV